MCPHVSRQVPSRCSMPLPSPHTVPPPTCLAAAGAGLGSGAAITTKTSTWFSPISEGLRGSCLTNRTV